MLKLDEDFDFINDVRAVSCVEILLVIEHACNTNFHETFHLENILLSLTQPSCEFN